MKGILGIITIIIMCVAKKGEALQKFWGVNCPATCQCNLYNVSQTLMSRWKDENENVKSAMCIIELETLESLANLPNDTESFTFLQAIDSKDITLVHDTMRMLEQVRIIDIQGSPGSGRLQIKDALFDDKLSLKYLYLQRVDLQESSKIFAKLESLEVLQVTDCNVGILKWEMLDGLSSLKELHLIQNGIKELYDFAFYGTPELRRLFLSHNELFSVDADNLVGLLKLEHLDLSNNNIDHLSGLTFPPMPHLQSLELKHNPIRIIFPHCFQFLNGTQHLTLGHRQQAVHLMKFSFRGLYSLLFLHIPNIDNDVLNEHMFYDLQSLLHLNLQGRVKMINARAFIGAHKVLQRLILHGCKIERIMGDAFFGLHKLKTLDLSSNRLSYLLEDLFNPLESLQELILHDNSFKSLPKDVFHGLQSLKALRLDDNPWNCNCNMSTWNEDIITRAHSGVPCTRKAKSHCKDKMSDYRPIPRCHHPSQYKGESVFKVLATHLNCADENEI